MQRQGEGLCGFPQVKSALENVQRFETVIGKRGDEDRLLF